MNPLLYFLAGIVASDPKAREMVIDGVKWMASEAGKILMPQKEDENDGD